MSKNCPIKIRNKWEKSGLLNGLPEEKQFQLSQLLENQARHVLFTGKDASNNFLARICFLVIYRTFANEFSEYPDENPELTFTFETSVTPAFTVFRPDRYDGKENCATLLHNYNYDFQMSKEEAEKILDSGYYGIDGEVELISILSEAFRKELNEKYAGKHLIFGYPIILDENKWNWSFRSSDLPKGNKWNWSYRCSVLPAGSRLCGGGYKK